jgi:hypothetical protein
MHIEARVVQVSGAEPLPAGAADDGVSSESSAATMSLAAVPLGSGMAVAPIKLTGLAETHPEGQCRAEQSDARAYGAAEGG